MKAAPLSVVLALSLLACGGGEEAPQLITPVVEPERTPDPEVPPPLEPTPQPEAPPEAEVPVAAPPVTANENVPTGPVEPIEELDYEAANFEMMHGTMRYGRVAFAAPVQQAIEQQLRAVMRQRMENFDTDSGDSENPNSFGMRCDVTLGSTRLVAYVCVAETMGGRGESFYENSTHGWEIVGEAIRELELDDLLIAGTQAELLTDSSDLTSESPMAPTLDGITFVHEDGETEDIPYGELGALLNVHSVLGRIPNAVAVATEETPLFLEARPPALIRVLTPAQPFARAVLSASALGTRWFFAAQGSAPIDVTTPLVFDAQEQVPAGMTATERPWTTPVRLALLRLKRPAQLRPTPRGRGAGVTLPANTRVYGVLGELSAGSSRTGGGQWTLVVAAEGLVGWLPSGTLQRVPQSMVRSVDAFVAGLPEAERARARTEAVAVAVEESTNRFGVVAYLNGADGSVIGYVPAVGPHETPALRVWLRHEGVLADARVVQPLGYGNDHLLLVAWLLPSDPTHHHWEAYTMPAQGTLAAAPAFTITLASPAAPRRERTTVTTALRRRSTFYPFVVRGPGRLETPYTWNGTTLIPPATAN